VLHNHRHHTGRDGATLDPFSSAPYFDGFIEATAAPISRDAPVAAPSTWLLRVGWRRHGLLGRDESPASAPVGRPTSRAS
jgi:hypothetical protein